MIWTHGRSVLRLKGIFVHRINEHQKTPFLPPPSACWSYKEIAKKCSSITFQLVNSMPFWNSAVLSINLATVDIEKIVGNTFGMPGFEPGAAVCEACTLSIVLRAPCLKS